MIHARDVSMVLVTRGDVDCTAILASYDSFGFQDRSVWNNSGDVDLAVYGRYAAVDRTSAPAVLVQDDDVLLPPDTIQALLDAYEPGRIVANMPVEYRRRYTDSCLVGFGAIFDRDLPTFAFARFHDANRIPDHYSLNGQARFFRTCDIVFTTLAPFTLVDLPFTMMPWTRAANRMYRQPGNAEERRQVLDLCRHVRDSTVSPHG